MTAAGRSDIADSVEHWIAVSPGPSDRFMPAVDELAHERPVVLLDLSGGRAQGFVVAAAGTVSAAVVNDMLVQARGTPWLVLPEERCAALGLAPLGRSLRPEALRFYTSIEARANVTTGVSAHDRALTMRVAAAPEASRDVISTPGHVMPIGVPADGMLRRAFRVDTALALTSRAGDPGGAAICAILDGDGEPSRWRGDPPIRARAFAAARLHGRGARCAPQRARARAARWRGQPGDGRRMRPGAHVRRPGRPPALRPHVG